MNCVMNGIIPDVALKYDKEERVYALDYIENEITEEERNSIKPCDIQKCIAAGVLPACYEGIAIEVELQEQSELSCFVRNEDGTVICPMGNTLSRLKMRGKNTVYANKDACRQCPHRCTGGRNYKTVSFGPETKIVPVRMYGSTRYRVAQLPPDFTLYNSFYRKDSVAKKVLLRIKPDKDKIKQRMCLSEHPFGTVKWYDGAHYLLCKGKEKATGELGLSFLAYNLRRAINAAGTARLLAAIRA